MTHVRVIWDFRGPKAQPTAEHHAVHLGEWAEENGYEDSEVGAEAGQPGHWMAWMTVPTEGVEFIRSALKPQRALPVDT